MTQIPNPEQPWDIRREGRAWSSEEWMPRLEMAPEKFESVGYKLFWDDEQRITLLAMLLENVGMDAAVRLGDARLWRAAIEALGQPER